MSVEATTERVPQLLALLQRRPSWTAAELAEELGVTDRSALRALAKLDQVMPSRLRAEVRAVRGATETLAGSAVEIDAEVLVTLARACRDAVRVRFR